MTNLLVKLFVKDYKNTENSDVRAAYGVFAGIVGIVCNLLLFAAKGIIGLLSGSIAVLADAFNNMTDAVSSIISLIGAKLANRPPDDEHPFGHERYEYIAAFIVAFLVLQVGFSCAQSAFGKILHPETLSFSTVSLVILLMSVGVKVWLSLFNRKLGERINSSVMKATAADAMGDVLTTSATIVSLLIFNFFHLNIDGWIGFAVALIVIWAGIGIARDTIRPLLGESADPKLVKEVSNHADIEESHELIDRIEREVTKKTGVFLVIHMDPIEVADQRVVQYREKIDEIVRNLDEQASTHDFRMVNGENHINLIFDVVVPHAYSDEQRNQLMFDIMEKVRAFDSRCQCVITMENSFT